MKRDDTLRSKQYTLCVEKRETVKTRSSHRGVKAPLTTRRPTHIILLILGCGATQVYALLGCGADSDPRIFLYRYTEVQWATKMFPPQPVTLPRSGFARVRGTEYPATKKAAASTPLSAETPWPRQGLNHGCVENTRPKEGDAPKSPHPC